MEILEVNLLKICEIDHRIETLKRDRLKNGLFLV